MIQSLTPDQFLNQSEKGVIIDVRTPAEYTQGHITGAINIPLFSNEERIIIGTLYKRQGRDIAVEKGLELVGIKLSSFVQQAKKAATNNSKTLFVYCWRGGMRSNSMAWLFKTAGLHVRLLKGGYKAYRHNFLSLLETENYAIRILGGPTGCGKTAILTELKKQGEQIIDLEGLAHHTGSAFGSLGQLPQPNNETFINQLHDIIRKIDPKRPIWCEGESVTIGKVFIPKEFHLLMQKAPFLYLTIPLSERVQRIKKEYGCFTSQELKDAFLRIEKRLGGFNTQNAIAAIDNGDIERAIEIAITYYDKGYNNSISQREGNITYLNCEKDLPEKTAQIIINKYNQL